MRVKNKPIHSLNEQWTIKGLSSSSIQVIGESSPMQHSSSWMQWWPRPNAACLAEFSLNPLFHRQWSSVYEALQDCRPDRKKLMLLYLQQLQEEAPPTEHILVAIDHTAWRRQSCQNIKRQNPWISGRRNYWTRVQYPCVDTRISRKLGPTPTTWTN